MEREVYTWLILVCSGHFLVYTLFAYGKNLCSNAVNVSENTVGINVPANSDALKYYISPKHSTKNHCDYLMFTQSLTEIYTNREEKKLTQAWLADLYVITSRSRLVELLSAHIAEPLLSHLLIGLLPRQPPHPHQASDL